VPGVFYSKPLVHYPQTSDGAGLHAALTSIMQQERAKTPEERERWLKVVADFENKTTSQPFSPNE
jgi:hypothetical protein